MVKEPRSGHVKTRLARDIGSVAAAWWYRHQSARVLRRLQDPRWRTVLAVSPDNDGLTSRVWPARSDLPRIPQGIGDLGERMRRIFRSPDHGPICIVGSDIPGMTPSHIAQAFRMLGSNDAVFGPAPDGGYWLIGLKRMRAMPTHILRAVRWSSPHALTDSIASMPDLRIGQITELRDVDTLADLKALST